MQMAKYLLRSVDMVTSKVAGNSLEKLINMELPMPYMPKVKNEADISNFSNYPDSDTPCPALKKSEDPFLDWFN